MSDNDDDFDDEQKQFISAVTAAPAEYGLTSADITALLSAQSAWQASLPAHKKAQADAITATTKKEGDKKELVGLVRGGKKKVKGTVSVTDVMLVAAGVDPRTTTRTPEPVPASRPLGRGELRANSTVVVHFVDEATPLKTAKPANVHGCEVWSFVGTAPPASPSGYAFLALDTRTPYADAHPATDAGKNAYYLLRWQNHKGEPGPWSDVITVKIPS